MKAFLILTLFILSLGYHIPDSKIYKIISADIFTSNQNKPPFAQSKKLPDLTAYTAFIKDDFNGDKLDTKIWGYYRKGDTVNNTVYSPQNAVVKNGKLFLIVDRTKTNYFSGVDVTPLRHFKYGYFEISAKLPKSIGGEAAFWFFPLGMPPTYAASNPALDGVEIDVFEYAPINFENLFYSLHWNGYDYKNGAQVSTSQDYVRGISNGYHNFGFEWTPKEYVVYVDNVERIRTNKIISRRHSNLILGFGTGGFGGNNHLGPWPDSFAIDYIKIYNRKPEIRIYGELNSNGWVSDGLQPGTYTTMQLNEKGVVNNESSSMEVPMGWKVIGYDNDNFKGDSIVITADTRNIGNSLNNKISSLKITLL
jgi:beta-glucanase (GH16 family)